MAVRFQPSEEEPSEPAASRENLAEVIELRSLLSKFDASSLPHAAELATVSELRSADRSADRSDEFTESQQPTDLAEPVSLKEPELPDTSEEATRLLARKALSSGELREALRLRGHPSDEVDVIVAEFEQALYLDDTALAQMVRDKLRDSKRASRSQIKVKLRERKVPDAIIEQVLVELSDDDEFELMRAAAQERARRLTGLDRQTAQRRLLGYLQRRGWQGEPVFRVVREVLA